MSICPGFTTTTLGSISTSSVVVICFSGSELVGCYTLNDNLLVIIVKLNTKTRMLLIMNIAKTSFTRSNFPVEWPFMLYSDSEQKHMHACTQL